MRDKKNHQGTKTPRESKLSSLCSWCLGGSSFLTHEFLHAMVLRIGDVKISFGIKGDAPWIGELAGFTSRLAHDFHRLIIRIEDLDAAVAELTNILASLF